MNSRVKYTILYPIIIIIFVFPIYLIYIKYNAFERHMPNSMILETKSEYNIFENQTKYIIKNETKYILYWTSMFRSADFMLGFGSDIFKECPVNNCFTTNNKSLKEVDEFDAIIFHAPNFNMQQKNVLPVKRRNDQIYVFATVEPPLFFGYNYLHYWKRFFNWTMTYRRDSDVVRTYGRVWKNETDYQLPTVEEIKKKRKKVAWVASNCNSNSRRELLVEKLNKYIQVDSYGKCGTLNCPGRMSDECYKMLEENYRFYLSFENAVCEEYITEKFYNILRLNLVPVVYGGGNYTINGPPHSYIDVRDFRSVKELGDYLNYLMNNYEEYLKYFEWKKHYVEQPGNGLYYKETLCQLCEKLHNIEKERKIYEDVALWWGGPNINRCIPKNKLPLIN